MLVQSVLKLKIANSLSAIKNKSTQSSFSPPSMPVAVVDAISKSYDDWVKQSAVIAGALATMTPGNVAGMKATLVLPNLTGLGPGFATYWSPVTFSGPGFIPANPINPATVVSSTVTLTAAIAAAVSTKMFKTDDQFYDYLSSSLFNATKGLIVIATTTSSPPVVTNLPLV